MNESAAGSLMIAAPQNVAAKIRDILMLANLIPCAVCHTGAEAVQAVRQGGALLLTTWRLPDMTGEELAGLLGEDTDVLMIVPRDYAGTVAENVMLLHNPISQDALIQAVRTFAYCHARMQILRVKARRLAAALEERKVIDRAKGRLMDTLHMTEAEAHHHIQKKSMDSGRRIADVAQEILEAAQIAAS